MRLVASPSVAFAQAVPPTPTLEAVQPWQRIVSVRITEGPGIAVEVGPIAGGVLLLIVLIGAVLWWWRFRRTWNVASATIKLGNIGDIRLERNHTTTQIAHQAWIELVTRKAAQPFDPENDLIVEVYNSWYALFGEFRALARTIPAHRVRHDPDTRKLVDLMIRVMDDGLRPHLTRWQARFRDWYDAELKTAERETPQRIQRRFPYYAEVVADIDRVTNGLIEYSKFLKDVATGH
jgi:hypothetical protein